MRKMVSAILFMVAAQAGFAQEDKGEAYHVMQLNSGGAVFANDMYYRYSPQMDACQNLHFDDPLAKGDLRLVGTVRASEAEFLNNCVW